MAGKTTLARDAGNRSIPAFELGTVHKIAITSTTAPSPVITEGITMIRVWCNVDYHLVTGATPVATTNLTPFTAKVTEFFKLKGGRDKAAAIKAAGANDGTLWITELI